MVVFMGKTDNLNHVVNFSIVFIKSRSLVLSKWWQRLPFSETMSQMVIHFSSTNWSLTGFELNSWFILASKVVTVSVSGVVGCHIFYEMLLYVLLLFFYTNGDSYACGDKTMIYYDLSALKPTLLQGRLFCLVTVWCHSLSDASVLMGGSYT